MPKIKTHQATKKRFQVKKSKKGFKVLKRTNGQDHFNSRENGNTRRNKRRDNSVSLPTQKTVLKALPYSQ